MKLKITLLVFFTFHFTCVLMVNMMAIAQINTDTTGDLNTYGKLYHNATKDIEFYKPVENTVSFYTNLTGTNRGYEFFSPNVSKAAVKYSFVSDDGTELRLLDHTFESKTKLLTFTYNSKMFFEEKEERDQFFKGICKTLFTNYPGVNAISIRGVFTTFDPLEESKPEDTFIHGETVLLSKITRK